MNAVLAARKGPLYNCTVLAAMLTAITALARSGLLRRITPSNTNWLGGTVCSVGDIIGCYLLVDFKQHGLIVMALNYNLITLH